MTELASWLRRRQLDDAAERAILKAVREANAEALPHPNHHLPGDPIRMRGIPILNVPGGLGGVMHGSRPDALDSGRRHR